MPTQFPFRIVFDTFKGSVPSIQSAVLLVDSLEFRFMIESAIEIIQHNKGTSKPSLAYSYQSMWLVHVVEEMVRHGVGFLVTDYERMREIIIALAIVKENKIRFHEAEHRENGPHWGTRLAWYRTNPMGSARALWILHFGDDSKFIWDDSYQVEQRDGLYYVIKGNGPGESFETPPQKEAAIG